MATVNVLYPSGHDFDLEYYLKTHMPLVSQTWAPLGLLNWEIVKFDSDAPYQIQAVLKWKDLDAWKAASTGETASTVLGDIPNFIKAEATILTGSEIAANRLV